MMRSLVRVLFAFLAACLAGALVQVLFAFTPTQIASPDEGLILLGVLSIVPKTMVQFLLFASPFVLVAAAVAEWQGIQDWIYYTLVGIAIAFAGFTTLHMGEGTDATLLHDYAMRAFLTTGAIAGFVYWMAGGRDAGGRDDEDNDGIEFTKAPASYPTVARDVKVPVPTPPPTPAAQQAPKPSTTSVPSVSPRMDTAPRSDTRPDVRPAAVQQPAPPPPQSPLSPAERIASADKGPDKNGTPTNGPPSKTGT